MSDDFADELLGRTTGWMNDENQRRLVLAGRELLGSLWQDPDLGNLQIRGSIRGDGYRVPIATGSFVGGEC